MSPERVNQRNGYRSRGWDTRVGSIELAVPKLRRGSYFPEWLLQGRKRAEKALMSVVAECCYLQGVSTRKVDAVVQQLGIEGISKSQVSELAQHLDAQVESFRNRRLDAEAYPYVWLDAMYVKSRAARPAHTRTMAFCDARARPKNRQSRQQLCWPPATHRDNSAGGRVMPKTVNCTRNVALMYASVIVTALGATAALAQEPPKACTLSESVKRVRWRDLPSERTEAHLCAEVPLTPDASGLVKCRVYWKLLEEQGANDVSRSHCSDYSYLSPAARDPFAELDGASSTPGEVCLVRQITSAQAERGKVGWYYQSSAPTRCPNLAPDLVMPSERPDVIDIYTQCAMTKTIAERDRVEEIDTAACIQPLPSAHAADVGAACEVPMVLNRTRYTLSLGDETCSTGSCLDTPLREQVCSANNGVPGCRSSATYCTCRCAGADGDPGPFCTCPDDYECKPLISELAGSRESRGSYCVSKDAWP